MLVTPNQLKRPRTEIKLTVIFWIFYFYFYFFNNLGVIKKLTFSTTPYKTMQFRRKHFIRFRNTVEPKPDITPNRHVQSFYC